MIARLIERGFRAMRRKPRPGRFQDLAAQYAERLRKWPPPSIQRGGQRIGIVITPWLCTPVPFFSIEIAAALARAGADVTLLWDSANVFFNAAKSSELECVHAIVRESSFRVVDVAATPPSESIDTAFLEPLVYENAVRQMRGEQRAPEFLESNSALMKNMRGHAGRIHALLGQESFDALLIPGGVWAASGLWTQIASARKVHFAAYDSGQGTLFVAQNGAAAHFADVADASRAVLAESTPEELRALVAQAHAALATRMEGHDDFRLQPKPSGNADHGEDACDILVPLNYRSDTAALFRQHAFASVTDWLAQLLEWAIRRGDVTVAIRQHPCERIPEYRGTDAWNEILAPFHAKLGQRLRFIAAEDPINTYDLLARARVVLPWTSRTGVEAAMMGKPVILGTHCYYRECGFTLNAKNAAEYFAFIDEALAGARAVSDEARERAALVYYLIEKCLALRTPFTPQPADFAKWVLMPPDELWASPPATILREALLTRQPVALLQHRRMHTRAKT